MTRESNCIRMPSKLSTRATSQTPAQNAAYCGQNSETNSKDSSFSLSATSLALLEHVRGRRCDKKEQIDQEEGAMVVIT